VLDLVTNARWRFPSAATRVALAPDGTALLTSDGSQLSVWTFSTGSATAQAARLSALTNATVAPGSNRLEWK
jgi:hypothetical protein